MVAMLGGCHAASIAVDDDQRHQRPGHTPQAGDARGEQHERDAHRGKCGGGGVELGQGA